MGTLRRPTVALHTVINERYEIVELLGSGGMGWVARALDRRLDNTELVLKFLHSHLVEDEELFQRFKNEIRLMRELTHPNIVRTFDYGEDGERGYYITMEYVKGRTLGQLLKAERGKGLPFDEIAHILYHIASGMAYAHAQGVIHRDLKPDNILIDEMGEAKISDFGLARSLIGEHNLTQTGNTVGTPNYMSPEQLQGEPLDHRCDIYSFGILAYEGCSGKRPFESENYLDLAKQHMFFPLPKMGTTNTDIPVWFQGFLEQCTHKKRDKRIQSFEEIGTLLLPFADYSKSNTSGPSSRKNKLLFEKWESRFYWSRLSSFLNNQRVAVRSFFLFTILLCYLLASGNNDWIRDDWVPLFFRIERTTGIPTSYFTHLALYRHVESAQYPQGKVIRPNIKYFNLALKKRDGHLVYLLLASGMNPESATEEKEPVILRQLRDNSLPSPHVLELLLNYGAEFEWQDQKGRDALMHAVFSGSRSMVATFLHHIRRANPEGYDRYLRRKDKDGKTALIHAIEGGNLAIIGTLLNENIQQAADKSGQTPLMHAVETGNQEVARMLLQKNEGTASINHKTKDGKSALHFALEANKEDLVDLLLRHGATTNAINSESGKNSLMYAVETNNLALVKKMLDQDQDPLASLQRKDKAGKTAQTHSKSSEISAYLKNVEQRYSR